MEAGSCTICRLLSWAEGVGCNDTPHDMVVQEAVEKDDNDKMELSEDMRAMEIKSMQSLEVMLDHTKEPFRMDDCSKWAKSELLSFLREHKLDPMPVPSKAVLVQLVKEMRKFVLTCMESIKNMPDDEEAAACVANALGRAKKEDLDCLEKWHAPVERERVLVHPQIQTGFRMDTLMEWIPACMPKFEDVFCTRRSEWCANNPSFDQNTTLSTHNQALLTLECIAYVFDVNFANPGNDMLATIEALPDAISEQVLSIRPLGAFIMEDCAGTDRKLPIPIIAVEWFRGKKVDGIKGVETYMSGLKKGTSFQGIKPKSLEEFEIIVELLRENRRALDVQNELKLLEKHATDKGWKFSVLCPADPHQKNGFAKLCAFCQKWAGKSCSRCGTTTYCSRECQTSHWKVHKKTCKAEK